MTKKIFDYFGVTHESPTFKFFFFMALVASAIWGVYWFAKVVVYVFAPFIRS